MVSTRYLNEIFKISPTPSILIKANAPHFEMVMPNPAFCKTMGIGEEELVGKKVFEIFPTNPQDGYSDGVDSLRFSFETVISTKKEHIMPRLRYDIEDRNLGVFQVRYWEPQNFPILDEEGNVEYILHLVVDVTEGATSRSQLEASEQQYKELIHSLDVIVWEVDLESNNCSYISPQAKSILGYDLEEWYVPGFWKEKLHPDDREWVVSHASNKIKEGQSYNIEYRMVRPDGSIVWMNDRISFVTAEDTVDKIRGVLTDITDKKIAENHILENEKKIRKILDHSIDIICTVDAEGKYREVNAAVEKIWGYTPDELVGKIFLDFVHKDDQEKSKIEVHNLIDGNPSIAFENRHITKDGETIPMLWSAHWDENEQRIFCVGKDATYIKEAEQQLKYSEQRFKSLVQHGGDFIAILDRSGINTYVSPTAKKITGWDVDHLLGYSALTFIHEDDVDRVTANFQRIVEGENVLTETFRILHKGGKYIWMETYAINMLDNPVINGIVINARDITEKKHYIEWHEYVNKATNNTIFDWNLEEAKIQWGGNTSLLFEGSEDLHRYTFTDYTNKIHPKDKENLLQKFVSLIKNIKELEFKSICRIAKAKGKYLDIEIDGYFIRNKSGKVIRMIGAMRDVTSQKKFERELKISNQRYELATRATSDVIYDWDLRTNNLHWGDGTEKLFGYKEGTLKPTIRSWYSRIHPKDYKAVINQIKGIVANGKNLWEGEYRFLKADGEYNYVYDRGFVVRDNQGKALRLVGAMQNIHQEKIREVEANLKLEIGNIFTHLETMDSCLKETLKAIRTVHEYAYAELWVTNPYNSTISLRAHYGKGRYVISEDQTSFAINEGLAGKIWSSNQPKFISSIENDNDFARKVLAKDNDFTNISGFPVHLYDQVNAVIIFFYKNDKHLSKSSPLSQEILNFLGNEIQRKKAEVQLDHFFELSPDLMSITDVKGTYLKINHAFEILLGYSKDELLRTNFIEMIHPEDMYIFEHLGDKVASGLIMNHESRMKKKSGGYLWLSWTAKPFPGDGHIIAVGKDISEKKIQEEALANAHQETLNILESIQDGFIAINHDWSVTYWNNAAEKIVKAKREDMLEKNIWNVFPAAKELKFYQEFNRVMEEGVSVRFDEYYAPLEIWMMISAYPSETGLTLYLKDITERKLASLKLIQFKKVIENSKDEIAILSTVNESIYLNSAYIESFGYGSEMLKQLGGPQKIFADEEQAADVFMDLLAGRHWKGDVELIGKSKTIRSYFISAGPINDDNGKLIAVFIIHTDISKRKETEGKMTSLYNSLQLQAKELIMNREELDQFSFIASKNLKEPIRHVIEKLQDFKTYYADGIDEKGLAEIHQALDHSERMRVLISELQNYTLVGKENGEFTKVDLNEVIKEITNSLREQIHAKYAIIDVPKFPLIKGNKSSFTEIFTTLITTVLKYFENSPKIQIHLDSDSYYWLFNIRIEGYPKDITEWKKISEFLKKPNFEMDLGQYIALGTIRKIVGRYKGRLLLEIKSSENSIFTLNILKNPER